MARYIGRDGRTLANLTAFSKALYYEAGLYVV